MGDLNITMGTQPDALIGKHVIQLDDQTRTGFNTHRLDEFASYLERFGEENQVIVYGAAGAAAWKESELSSRYGEPTAVCTLEISRALQLVRNVNGRSMNLRDFEQFIRRMLAYSADEKNMTLLDRLRDFTVSKVTQIDQQKDNAGNYLFSITRKAGKNDWKPPKELAFTVPMFKGMDQAITVVMEFSFDFEQAGESVAMEFTLEDLTLEETVEMAMESAIKDGIKDCAGDKYRGARAIVEKDDSWRYQDNGLDCVE